MTQSQDPKHLARRKFLKTAGAMAAGVGFTNRLGFPCEEARLDMPLTELSASKLAKLIADGDVSAEKVAEAYLARIKEVNPKLNAIFQVDPDRILKEARQADCELAQGKRRGPLHGVPFSMKDQLLTKGMITTNGCPELKDFIPTEDATVVRRLKNAGGILLGKTNVPEMCYQGITDNLVYGRTSNPYDLKRTPGGSSGGEAAIIAAGGSPFGLGTDLGDSIRTPAHFCGIAAIKPTARLVPETGMLSAFPISFYDWNSIGPLARYVEDVELLLSIIAGPDEHDPYVVPVQLRNSRDVDLGAMRIALCFDDGATTPTAATIRTVERAAQVIGNADMEVVEVRPPQMECVHDIWLFNISPLWARAAEHFPREYAELAHSRVSDKRHSSTELLVAWLNRWQEEFDFGWQRKLRLLNQLERYRKAMTWFMNDGKYDAILSPVTNNPAPLHDNSMPDLPSSAAKGWEAVKAEIGGFCVAHNLTGWPAAVVRAGTSPDGLPIGVQIAAKPWREDVAIAVAKVIEERLGGWKPSPLL
jgi:amidase